VREVPSDGGHFSLYRVYTVTVVENVVGHTGTHIGHAMVYDDTRTRCWVYFVIQDGDESFATANGGVRFRRVTE
jgi:hypothetical protein